MFSMFDLWLATTKLYGLVCLSKILRVNIVDVLLLCSKQEFQSSCRLCALLNNLWLVLHFPLAKG